MRTYEKFLELRRKGISPRQALAAKVCLDNTAPEDQDQAYLTILRLLGLPNK